MSAYSPEINKHFAENLDTIINATGIGLWDWDLTTGKIVHSGQLERIAGYTAGDLPDADASARDQLIYPADRERADGIIQACINGTIDNYETEFRIRCRNGDVKWVQDRGAVAGRNEEGKAIRIVGMFYDFNRFKSTEESLAEKVRLMDFVSGMSGLGTLDWEIQTGGLNFDDEFLRMFGYARGEVAQTFSELCHFIHEDDYRNFAEALAAYILANNGEDIFSHQVRAFHKDGTAIWVMTTVRVVEWDAEGKPKRAYAGVLNVDRLVRAELEAQKALMENQLHKEQLQKDVDIALRDLEATRRTSDAMFEANPFMCMLFDDTFTPVDCNPAVLEYFHSGSKAHLLGHIVETLNDAIPEFQPDGVRSVSFAQRMTEAVNTGYCEFETTFVFGGEPVPMNIIMKRIPYNDTFAIVAYHVDLTKIKQSENALLHQEKLLQSTNEVATSLMSSESEGFLAILASSLETLGSSLGADRAYIWENTFEEGKLFANELCIWQGAGVKHPATGHRLHLDESLPHWRDMIQNLTAVNTSAGELRQQYGFAGEAGDAQSVLLVPIALQGKFWGVLGFEDCRDADRIFTTSEENIMRSAGILIGAAVLRNEITQNLIDAREAALDGSRAKSDFLSRMSHEIRTPLNAIIGMSAVAEKSEDASRLRYCLSKIDTASRQLLELINDILDMSKIEANKLEITSNEFDFEKMVQNICQVVNVKMDEKNLELSFDFQELFLRKVICDELRLTQVLINLLNNAAKFTPDDGNILVRVGHRPKGSGEGDRSVLRVEVKDSGIGISQEQQDRLFNAFEQADSSTTRQYGGTGLGLSICKSIVRLMGGDIRVESVEGQGSTFIFEVDFQWGGPLEEGLPEPEIKKDLRILVVDDSEDVLIYFHNILSNYTTVCHTAAGGEAALARVKESQANGRPYDVIFVDWQMPGLSGKDTVGAIRELVGDTAKLVMISVADRDDVERDIGSLSVDNILAKPVLPSTLYNTVVALTDQTRVFDQVPVEEFVPDWGDKRVLLVEDIEINREILLSILEETCLQIDCAGDGVDAIETFTADPEAYDLILMDVQMPRMDGLTATRKLRTSGLPHSEEIPIIAMTANAFKEDVEACQDAGMNSHVAKPVDINDLFESLSRYLGAGK